MDQICRDGLNNRNPDFHLEVDKMIGAISSRGLLKLAHFLVVVLRGNEIVRVI